MVELVIQCNDFPYNYIFFPNPMLFIFRNPTLKRCFPLQYLCLLYLAKLSVCVTLYSTLSFQTFRLKVYVIVWWLDLQLHMKSVSINTNDVSSNPAYGEVYSTTYCVIKFVSDLWQVCGFLLVLRFPPPIKLTATILLK
jgi:hypothetical protein